MEDECGIDLQCYEQIPTEEEFDELNGSMEEKAIVVSLPVATLTVSTILVYR